MKKLNQKIKQLVEFIDNESYCWEVEVDTPNGTCGYDYDDHTDYVERQNETQAKINKLNQDFNDVDEYIDYDIKEQFIQVLCSLEEKYIDLNDTVSYAVSNAFAELITCLDCNSKSVAKKLVQSLNRKTSDRWELREENSRTSLINLDNPENSFEIKDGTAWFGGSDEALGLPVLSVPFTGDEQDLEGYAKLIATLRGEPTSQIQTIKEDISKPNPLYERIPELESAVCEVAFDFGYSKVQEKVQDIEMTR